MPVSYRNTFLSSPVADTVLVLACPLLALAGLTVLMELQVLTLGMFIAVTAIYTGAHHLPGFLRAYGTREVFEAHRNRLLLAPVLILAVLLFMEFQEWRGYIIVLWFFNWWHTAMQNYGLLRIYERKSLQPVSSSVNLDFASILVWHFTASELLPDDMRFELAQHLFNLNITDPGTVTAILSTLRWAGVAASVVLLVLYVRNAISQFQANAVVAINKQLFLFSTYAVYVYMFSMFTKDIATSVESFFHNTQYLFFAWVLQRRLAEKAGEESPFNPAGSLFSIRGKGLALTAYLTAIAAYGFLVGGSIKPRIDSGALLPIFNVFYATAAFLHYYTDSFIWKARSREMVSTLSLAGEAVEPAKRSFWFSTAELSAIVLIPIILATALSNPSNVGHQSVRESQTLARFSEQLLGDTARWGGAAVAAADVGDWLWTNELYDEAGKWWERAISIRPDYADAHQALGHLYSSRSQHRRAVESYERALALDPSFTASNNNLGNAYLELGDFQRAKQAYERALALDPRWIEPRLNLGELYMRQNRPEEARREFQAVLDREPENVDAIRGLAETAALQANWEEARKQFTRIIENDPNWGVGYLQLGKVLVIEGKAEEARVQFEMAASKDPTNPEPLYQLGVLSLSTGKYERAIAELTKALDVYKDNPAVRAALGRAYLKKGKPDLALEHLAEAVRLDPSLGPAYADLAEIWKKKGDETIAAMYRARAAKYGGR